MSTIEEQILAIEKEIRETPYHKATEHHIGKLRARLSRLKDKIIEDSARLRKTSARQGGGYAVKKQGNATVILIGPPSAGKSTLINKLTNAKSKVAPYAFTTVSVIPGMMEYKSAKIQILDVPGLIEGAEEGKGRGREVLSVARGADLIILMTDVEREEAIERIHKALERNGIRLNIVRPSVVIDKKISGGIIVHSNIKQDIGLPTIKDVARELGIKNAEITINEKLTLDRLIDAFNQNRVYLPAISVINKSDLTPDSPIINHPVRNASQSDIGDQPLLYISAEKETGLDKLKEMIWNTLEFIRVYLVRPGEEPSTNHPIVVKKNTHLTEIAEEIGTEFAEDKKRAKIWGTGSKFPGQEVSLSTKVVEGIQVRFV